MRSGKMAARTLVPAVQQAVRSGATQATCRVTPANRALAAALRRAGFLAWDLVGGYQPPAPSVVAAIPAAELADLRAAPQRSAHKHQLWVGLRYHDDHDARPGRGPGVLGPGVGPGRVRARQSALLAALAGVEGGVGEELAAGPTGRRVPVIQEIQGWSVGGKAVWLPEAQLDEIVRGGQPFGDASWMAGLEPGQGLFLDTERGVLDIHEALERRLGGHLICRVWSNPAPTRGGGSPGEGEGEGKIDSGDKSSTAER